MRLAANQLGRWVLVVLTALFFSTVAVAKESKKNEFPNATRKEPKTQTSAAYDKVKSGYDALEEGEDAKAKKLLEEAAANKRATPYEQALVNQALSQLAYNADDVTGALAYNQKAVDLDALDNKSHFNLLYQIAQLSLMEEKYEPAMVAIEQWFKLSGAETADAYALKGNAAYRLERMPQAAESMKKAIALSQKPSSTWYQILIASYFDSGNLDQAAVEAEQILAKDPTNKQMIQQLASIYLEQEKNDKALAILEGAYQKGLLKESSEIRQLYQMYNYVEKPQKAIEVINDGLAKGILKADFDTLKGLADAYSTAEQWDKAAETYGKAAAFAKNGEMEFLQAQILIQENDRFADGKKAMQSAIAKGGLKREGEAYILLGNAEYELGNTPAAIVAYQKARGYPSTQRMADAWLKSIKGR